jgi:hypothetical protein
MRLPSPSSCLALLAAVMGMAGPAEAFAFAEIDPGYQGVPPSRSGSCDREIASLPDDSIFVSVDGTIAKLGPDGRLDLGWGLEGGRARLFYIQADALQALPDGGLLVIHDVILRYTASGTFDSSFGTNGRSDPVTTNSVHSVALQPDGGIVVLGNTSTTFTRIDARGRFDTTFGTGGSMLIVDPSNPAAPGGSTIFAWSIGADGFAEVASYRNAANGQVVPELHRFPADFPRHPSAAVVGRLLPVKGLANWLSPVANVDAFGNLALVTGQGGFNSPSGITAMLFDRNANAGRIFVPVTGSWTTILTYVHAKALWRTADGGWLALAQVDQQTDGFFGMKYESMTRAIRLRADGSVDTVFPQGQAVGGAELTKFARLKSGKLIHFDPTPAGCTAVRQLTGEPQVERVMVEYYHPLLDHYFMTLEGFESAILDKNAAQMGWLRTGQSFGAWAPVALPGTKRLCRFYGDLAAGPNSHFFTPEGPECDGLRAMEAATPIGRAAWRFEEFAASVVDAVDNECPANLTAVYRTYNNGASRGITSNHRYMTDVRIYEEMVGKGWAPEGVRFCVPPESSSITTF